MNTETVLSSTGNDCVHTNFRKIFFTNVCVLFQKSWCRSWGYIQACMECQRRMVSSSEQHWYFLKKNPQENFFSTKGAMKIVRFDENTNNSGENTQEQKSGAVDGRQNLDGHLGQVTVAVWNETYRKLTTADKTGMIVVWILHRGKWFKEMVCTVVDFLSYIFEFPGEQQS